MAEPLVIEMMSRKTLLWRCLHSGSFSIESIGQCDRKESIPGETFCARNLPFLENLTETYGACAVVARVGGNFVGHLRFYPKAVRELAEPGLAVCLQQEFPYGPPRDFGRRRFPPLKEIKDKTLVVHCLMLVSGKSPDESRRRKGIGTRMARALIGWATTNGWQAIESTAYTDLPIVYSITGQTGRRFWEQLGFRLVRTEREPALEDDTDFVRRMREEASSRGLDPATITNKYVMRLDLPSESQPR